MCVWRIADEQWVEGYQYIVQWHLIGGSTKSAHSLIHACTSWASITRDAVLVFDQSFWQPDYKLYQAIQQVRTAHLPPAGSSPRPSLLPY